MLGEAQLTVHKVYENKTLLATGITIPPLCFAQLATAGACDGPFSPGAVE